MKRNCDFCGDFEDDDYDDEDVCLIFLRSFFFFCRRNPDANRKVGQSALHNS